MSASGFSSKNFASRLAKLIGVRKNVLLDFDRLFSGIGVSASIGIRDTHSTV